MSDLLVLRRTYGGDLTPLAGRFALRIADEPLRPRLLRGEDTEATAIWTFGERIDDELLDAVPQLMAVANHGVGIETIDQAALAARGVKLIVPRGANAEAVADHAFALLLAVRRRIVTADALVRRGEWVARGRNEPVGTDVHGTALGIVGLGAIGRAVARRAAGFGMRVRYCSRRRLDAVSERALGVEHVPLDELLERSDAVSLHCPLTPATRGLIDAAALARMPAHAVLINTARGALCDERALVEALAAGRLAGAGLDVFADEPSVPGALAALESVVLTPHVADLTTGAEAALTAAIVAGLLGVERRATTPTGRIPLGPG